MPENATLFQPTYTAYELQPAQESKPVNYLMYPYAEVNGKALDYFDPENFRYLVQFKQL